MSGTRTLGRRGASRPGGPPPMASAQTRSRRTELTTPGRTPRRAAPSAARPCRPWKRRRLHRPSYRHETCPRCVREPDPPRRPHPADRAQDRPEVPDAGVPHRAAPIAQDEVNQLADGWEQLQRLRDERDEADQALAAVTDFGRRSWRPRADAVIRAGGFGRTRAHPDYLIVGLGRAAPGESRRPRPAGRRFHRAAAASRAAARSVTGYDGRTGLSQENDISFVIRYMTEADRVPAVGPRERPSGEVLSRSR
jgi:hypothetical protein